MHELHELRDSVSELCRRFPSEQKRMNPIQQYLDASSIVFQERSNDIPVRTKDDHNEPHVHADKPGGSDEIKTYGSFQEWLSRFAPADSGSSDNSIQTTGSEANNKNIPPQGHSTSNPKILRPLQSEAMRKAAGNLRITVTNLKKGYLGTEFSETVELDACDYVYKLSQILYDRGMWKPPLGIGHEIEPVNPVLN